MTIGDAPELPEGKTHEETIEVIIRAPDGKAITTIPRERLRAINLAGMLVAYIDAKGNTHRVVGLPLELVTRETAILRPV